MFTKYKGPNPDRLFQNYIFYYLLILAAIFLLLSCSSVPEKVGISKVPKSDKVPLKPVKGKKTDTILVKFKPGIEPQVKKKKLDKESIVEPEKIRDLPVYKIKVNSDEVSEELRQLNEDAQVDYAEANQFVSALVTPNDPYYGSQYGLSKISASKGWDIETGTTSQIKIAVVDTVVDFNHPDLSSKIIGGYDFINGDSIADDDHGHGTHVAGIAGGMTNNSIGIAGVSWGAKIMPVKVLSSSGSGSYSSVSNGTTYAVDNGAKVINLSLGGYSFSQTMQAATD